MVNIYHWVNLYLDMKNRAENRCWVIEFQWAKPSNCDELHSETEIEQEIWSLENEEEFYGKEQPGWQSGGGYS